MESRRSGSGLSSSLSRLGSSPCIGVGFVLVSGLGLREDLRSRIKLGLGLGLGS